MGVGKEQEVWKVIPGYTTYEVSTFGGVRRIAPTHKNRAGFVPARTVGSDGRLRVTLYENGRQDKWNVHQLVMLAFRGPTPVGLEIRHLDGNHQSDRLSNLEFGTHKQNGQDMIRHGALPRGSDNHNTKMTEMQVLEIRRRASLGEPLTALAEEFGIGTTTVGNIVRRVTWRYL